jgi:hypothetical protein
MFIPHSRVLTTDDVRVLKSLRISPDDICPACSGTKCKACQRTGLVRVTIHESHCDGIDCECADTKGTR